MLGTVATIAREKGLPALWKGLALRLHRQSLTIAITIANPTILIKVQLQAERKLPLGVPRRYSAAQDAYSTTIRQEGILALWTGLAPKNCQD
ncbi:Mitochondrial uncoupling protein 1, partial [Bienertia sinuspersici]